jgi:hypothetical protein
MKNKPLITRIRNWIEHRRYKRAMKVLARHILYNNTPIPEMIISVDNNDIVFSISTLEQREILFALLMEQEIHKWAK